MAGVEKRVRRMSPGRSWQYNVTLYKERQPTGASLRRETSSKIRERDGETRRVTCGSGVDSRLTRARKVGSMLCIDRATRLRSGTQRQRGCGLLSGEINTDGDRTNWSFV